MALADIRARLAAQWDRADTDEPLIERLTDAPVPDHWTCWRVNGSHVALPTLSPLAPFEVQTRYLQRVVATARGSCALCGAVAEVHGADPDEHLAAWRVAPVSVGLVHATGCPAEFGDADRQWFPALRASDERPRPRGPRPAADRRDPGRRTCRVQARPGPAVSRARRPRPECRAGRSPACADSVSGTRATSHASAGGPHDEQPRAVELRAPLPRGQGALRRSRARATVAAEAEEARTRCGSASRARPPSPGGPSGSTPTRPRWSRSGANSRASPRRTEPRGEGESRERSLQRRGATDERAEQLRHEVPDDPVRLPSGHVACPCCGIAVWDPDPPRFTDQESMSQGWGDTAPSGSPGAPRASRSPRTSPRSWRRTRRSPRGSARRWPASGSRARCSAWPCSGLRHRGQRRAAGRADARGGERAPVPPPAGAGPGAVQSEAVGALSA